MKVELEAENKIQTFPYEEYPDEEKPILSFYINLTNAPYRVKVKASDCPDELARKFFQTCFVKNQTQQLPEQRQQVLVDSIAYMIRTYKSALTGQALQTSSLPFTQTATQKLHQNTQTSEPDPEALEEVSPQMQHGSNIIH